MELDEVTEKVSDAIHQFLKHDGILLCNDVHERSITHWLAVHLSSSFKEWNVDCEYNRDRSDVKELLLCRESNRSNCIDLELGEAAEIPFEYLDKSKVYPDIIVHHRNTDENLLVIEVKKSTSSGSREFDLHKLRAYMSQLGYRYGAFVRFCAKGDYRSAVFRDEQPFSWCWMMADADGSLNAYHIEIPA